MSSTGSGNNQCNIQNVLHDLQNSKDPAIPDKASEDVGIPSQFYRDSNSSADLLKDTLSCAVRSSVQAPSPHFLFDVSSEDGIQLFVDLNSSPSDWIESLKNGVHICSDTNKPVSPSHHEIGWRCCCNQMEGSSLVDSYNEVDNGDVEEGSHPVTTGVGALPESNELNGAEGSLSSGRNPVNTAHHLDNFGEEHATTSSRPEPDVEKHRASLCRDFACQPKSNGTDHCGLINSVTCTKMQAFEVVVDHAKSASPSCLVNGHSSYPTDVNRDKVETENNKASTSGEYDRQILEAQEHQANNLLNGTSLSLPRNYESGDANLISSIETDNRFILRSHEDAQQAVEIHSSLDDVQRHESLLYSCNNSVSPTFGAPEQNGAGHCTPPDSDELDNDVRKSQSTSMEVLGRVLIGDQRKKPECLDFRDSMTDSQSKSSGSESDHGCKRKRQLNGTEGQSQLVKHDAKITRIPRRFTGKIHDSRRRSTRLFTK